MEQTSRPGSFALAIAESFEPSTMPHIDATSAIQQLFPYLIVRNVPAAIDFYKRVFDAEEIMRLPSLAVASVTPN